MHVLILWYIFFLHVVSVFVHFAFTRIACFSIFNFKKISKNCIIFCIAIFHRNVAFCSKFIWLTRKFYVRKNQLNELNWVYWIQFGNAFHHNLCIWFCWVVIEWEWVWRAATYRIIYSNWLPLTLVVHDVASEPKRLRCHWRVLFSSTFLGFDIFRCRTFRVIRAFSAARFGPHERRQSHSYQFYKKIRNNGANWLWQKEQTNEKQIGAHGYCRIIYHRVARNWRVTRHLSRTNDICVDCSSSHAHSAMGHFFRVIDQSASFNLRHLARATRPTVCVFVRVSGALMQCRESNQLKTK